jgi:hypothetical protein
MTDEEVEQRALMLSNAREYTSVAPSPAEIDAREAAALAGLSQDDVEIVRRKSHEINQARLMSRL